MKYPLPTSGKDTLSSTAKSESRAAHSGRLRDTPSDRSPRPRPPTLGRAGRTEPVPCREQVTVRRRQSRKAITLSFSCFGSVRGRE